MADVNVYVPDELKARLEKADLPLSQLARDVWEWELRRRQEVEEMGELSIDAAENGVDVELRFTGEHLGGGVYRTDDGDAVLVGEEDYNVWTQTEINENEEAFVGAVWDTVRIYNGEDNETVGFVARKFGVKPIIRL
jgi:hypothetical protein